MRGRMLVLALATGSVAAAGASSAWAAVLPKIPTYSGVTSRHDFQVRPASIVYTGDGSGYFAGQRKSNGRAAPIDWTVWTAKGALGTGYNWVDNCRPNCAGGTFHTYPVTLKLSDPQRVKDHLIFKHMRVTYTGQKPKGEKHRTQVWTVKHSGKDFYWAFPPL